MEGLGVFLVVVAAFVANLPALREQWRTDRAGSIKAIWMFGVYLLYIGLGIVVVLLLAPREGGHEDKAPYLSGFIVGFILYGGLTLGLMAATGAVAHDAIEGYCVLGELALDGSKNSSRASISWDKLRPGLQYPQTVTQYSNWFANRALLWPNRGCRASCVASVASRRAAASIHSEPC